jgi:membrane-associated protease RseP (regulator of RpoE activity)
MPITAAIGLYIILNSVIIYLSNALARSFARSVTPLANILIPGLNPYLPIAYGWIALIIGIVVHEGAHGILARSGKFTVKSTGLLLFLGIPIGAFAELDDKELANAPGRNAGKVMAGGPGGNILAALAALAVLILIVSTMTPVANGIGVLAVVEDYPAHEAGIKPGDIIIQVNGQPATLTSFSNILANSKPGDKVEFSTLRVEESGSYSRKDYTLRLATNPFNNSLPFVGITAVDPGVVLEEYRRLGFSSPLIYLVWPTLATSQSRIPYSDTMYRFYNSSIGPAFQPLANLIFWVWFVNFNLAIFNALPLYPLDGGQAFKVMLKALAKGSRLESVSAISYVLN